MATRPRLRPLVVWLAALELLLVGQRIQPPGQPRAVAEAPAGGEELAAGSSEAWGPRIYGVDLHAERRAPATPGEGEQRLRELAARAFPNAAVHAGLRYTDGSRALRTQRQTLFSHHLARQPLVGQRQLLLRAGTERLFFTGSERLDAWSTLLGVPPPPSPTPLAWLELPARPPISQHPDARIVASDPEAFSAMGTEGVLPHPGLVLVDSDPGVQDGQAALEAPGGGASGSGGGTFLGMETRRPGDWYGGRHEVWVDARARAGSCSVRPGHPAGPPRWTPIAPRPVLRCRSFPRCPARGPGQPLPDCRSPACERPRAVPRRAAAASLPLPPRRAVGRSPGESPGAPGLDGHPSMLPISPGLGPSASLRPRQRLFFMSRSLTEHERAGLSSATADPTLAAAAIRNIEGWLSNPDVAAYQPLLGRLLDDQQWDLLLDSFYRVLPFGTGGRRGPVGIGPNRINPYSITSSVQGHVAFLKKVFPGEALRVVIAADVRCFQDLRGIYPADVPNPMLGMTSKDLARLSAEVYAANEVEVWMLPETDPVHGTPELSYCIRQLEAHGGLNISASHNHPDDNGGKFYNALGGQEIAPRDEEMVAEVERVTEVRSMPFEEARAAGRVRDLPEALYDGYLDLNLGLSLAPEHRAATVVFSNLHGVGDDTAGVILEAGWLRCPLRREPACPRWSLPECRLAGTQPGAEERAGAGRGPGHRAGCRHHPGH